MRAPTTTPQTTSPTRRRLRSIRSGLVSVPNTAAIAGDGDSQGDAKVAGTNYNATGQIRCAGYKGAAAGMCEAGVVRDAETGPYIDVTLPEDDWAQTYDVALDTAGARTPQERHKAGDAVTIPARSCLLLRATS